ncbi:hypothetical protein H072_1901 [Dactylellina haptotyla CBS 200.50]|uniref:Uncharacterized protein n=1 Tax=Dactylellina haptotyla (strain CBS 200.50) TaxID=1284197 RepID=S8AMD7_DACHA|nr:hypothetical protein H072_1901 [Dactylellina haptotyla CBS 200.50]
MGNSQSAPLQSVGLRDKSTQSESTFKTHFRAFKAAFTNPENYKNGAKDGVLDWLKDPFQVDSDFTLSDAIVHVTHHDND